MTADASTDLRSLSEIREALRRFAADRDWDQFHTPKNLAIGISVEAGELLERFQWMTDEASCRLTDDQLAAVREELADVLLYLVRLADKLEVDLMAAAARKIELNGKKYPVEVARGRTTKYTSL